VYEGVGVAEIVQKLVAQALAHVRARHETGDIE
jgi:hypothetical protein